MESNSPPLLPHLSIGFQIDLMKIRDSPRFFATGIACQKHVVVLLLTNETTIAHANENRVTRVCRRERKENIGKKRAGPTKGTYLNRSRRFLFGDECSFRKKYSTRISFYRQWSMLKAGNYPQS